MAQSNFRIRTPISKNAKMIYGILGAVFLFLCYEFVAYRQYLKNPTDTTIPGIHRMWNGVLQITEFHSDDELQKIFGVEVEESSLWEKIGTTFIWKDVSATYGRIFVGLAWGCLAAMFVGVMMGCYESIAAFLLPTLSFLAKAPGTAMLAVFFVLAGTGELMFTAMIGFGVLPTLIQSIYLITKNEIHEEQVNKAYTLGASNVEVIWNVIVRQIIPSVLDAIRLQFGPAMVYLIAAEMLVGQVGMGYQIRMQQKLLNMAVVYDYIIILGILGLIFDRAMIFLQGVLCPWYVKLK